MNKQKSAGILTVVVLCACDPTARRAEGPAQSQAQPREDLQALQTLEDAASEIEARCQRIQQSDRLPISCQIDIVDGTARMQVVMSNRAVAETYFDDAENELIIPFCRLTNAMQQPSGVVLSLYEERLMRVADCPTMSYSEWVSADPRVQQLAAAAGVCQAIQESAYPVGCSMGVLDEVPSLIVSYSRSRMSRDDVHEVRRIVGAPFCRATSSLGMEAHLYLIEDDVRAKGYNCSTAEETKWFDVRRAQAGRPGTRAAPRTQRGIVYERVPVRAQN